jgi:signal recognition particle subunit SEC65
MSVSSGEVEDLREVIRDMVFMFKTVWEEIDKQFPNLSRDEKYRVFCIVAPSVADMMYTMMEDIAEYLEKPKKRRKSK